MGASGVLLNISKDGTKYILIGFCRVPSFLLALAARALSL
jgi:hypothetical protein